MYWPNLFQFQCISLCSCYCASPSKKILENIQILPPANEICEGNVCTGVCLSTMGACMVRGACVVKRGMHGKRRVCMAKGACIVNGECTWEYVWQKGGMHGKGGIHGRGACVTRGMYGRGHAWQEGMHAGEKVTEAGGTHPTGMHSCITLS